MAAPENYQEIIKTTLPAHSFVISTNNIRTTLATRTVLIAFLFGRFLLSFQLFTTYYTSPLFTFVNMPMHMEPETYDVPRDSVKTLSSDASSFSENLQP